MVCGHTCPIESGRCFRPSHTTISTSCTPRFFSSDNTRSQYFAPPSRRRARRPIIRGCRRCRPQSPPHHDVDRPVGHVAVADRDVDAVDEQHRIHRVQRPVLHSAMPSITRSVIVEIVCLDTSAP